MAVRLEKELIAVRTAAEKAPGGGPGLGFETDGGAIIYGASALSPGRAPYILPLIIFIVLRILRGL